MEALATAGDALDGAEQPLDGQRLVDLLDSALPQPPDPMDTCGDSSDGEETTDEAAPSRTARRRGRRGRGANIPREYSVEPVPDKVMMRRILDELPFFVQHLVPPTQDERDDNTREKNKVKLFKSVAEDLKSANIEHPQYKWSTRLVKEKSHWLVSVLCDAKHPSHAKLGDDLRALLEAYRSAPIASLRGLLGRFEKEIRDELWAHGPKGITYDDVLLRTMFRRLEFGRTSLNGVWEDVAAYMNRKTGTSVFSPAWCKKRAEKVLAVYRGETSYPTIRLTTLQKLRLEDIDNKLSQSSVDAIGKPPATGRGTSKRTAQPAKAHGYRRVRKDDDEEMKSDSEGPRGRRGRAEDEETKGGVSKQPAKRQRVCYSIISTPMSGDSSLDRAGQTDHHTVEASVQDVCVSSSPNHHQPTWEDIFREVVNALDEKARGDLKIEQPLEKVCQALADALGLEAPDAVPNLRSESEKMIKEVLKLFQHGSQTTLGLDAWTALSNREVAELTDWLEKAQGPPCRAITTAAKSAIDAIQRALASCIVRQQEIMESVRRVDVEAIRADVDALTKWIDTRTDQRRADATQCQRNKVDVDKKVSDVESALEEELTHRVQELIKAGKDKRSARLEAVMAFPSSSVAQDLDQKRDQLQAQSKIAHASAEKATAWLAFVEKLSALHRLVLPIVNNWVEQSAIRVQEEKRDAELAVEAQILDYASKIVQPLRTYINVHVGRVERADKALEALRAEEAESETEGDLMKIAPHQQDKNQSLVKLETVRSGNMKLWIGKDGLFSRNVLNKVAAAYDPLPGEENAEVHEMMNQWTNLIRSLQPAAPFVGSMASLVESNDTQEANIQQVHEEPQGDVLDEQPEIKWMGTPGVTVRDREEGDMSTDEEPTSPPSQHEAKVPEGVRGLLSRFCLW